MMRLCDYAIGAYRFSASMLPRFTGFKPLPRITAFTGLQTKKEDKNDNP
jgi:hypothetical protein